MGLTLNPALSVELDIIAQSSISSIFEEFKLTVKDAAIIKEYLEDFQKGDTDSHNKILEQVMGALYALHPPNAPFDKKVAKHVSALQINLFTP
jgi:hypothetical protein